MCPPQYRSAWARRVRAGGLPQRRAWPRKRRPARRQRQPTSPMHRQRRASSATSPSTISAPPWSKPVQLADVDFTSNYNPGEVFSCMVLNGMGDAYLENISFSDVHVTFPGGGTVEQGAVRDVPKVAGEYYAIGVPPAYALYARNVRGLTLHNVRFEMADADLRPAVVFDHVTDAAVNGMSVQ